MKHTLTLVVMVVVYFFSPAVIAQQSYIDSLRGVLAREINSEKRIEVYDLIAKEARELDLESALLYADTLESMATRANSDRGRAKALNLRGDILKDKGDLKAAIALYQQELVIRNRLEDKIGVAQAYNDLGASYSDEYNPDSAIVYYLMAVKINEALGEFSNVASAYSNIGNLYTDQKVHDKGIMYLEKALKIRLEHGEEKKAMYTYNNLAVAYGSKEENKQENVKKAIQYAQKGVQIALKYDNTFVAGVIEGGICHLLNDQKRYKEAIGYAEKSIAHLEAAKRTPNLVFPLINLATAYNSLNQPAEALRYAERGYAIMLERNLIDPLEVYYEEMANSNEQLGNHRQALVWYKKFMALDDSLFKAENVKNLADIETKYETEKKEKELVAQRAQIFRQRTWLIGLLAGILALVVVGYLYYHRYRLRQKAILDAAIIREQQVGLNAVIEAQEAERKRIAKDLHDGIAQELVALKLGMMSMQARIETLAPGEARKLQRLTEQLDDSCKEVRTLSHVMMPPTLGQFGLVPSLEMLLRTTFEHLELETEFEHYNLPERLDEKTELGLYRITQELLNNIIKHAQANKVLLQLYQAGNNLILRIEDNGRSFNFDQARRQGSMGLLNILSRVSTLGGTFTSETGSPYGTVSTIRVPLAR